MRFCSSTLAVLLSVATVLFLAAHLDGVTAKLTASEKCSACDLIVDELELIFHEDDRTNEHVDLRNRLNTQGKRVGKVLPYRHSEMRLYSVTERLCAHVADRTYDHGTLTFPNDDETDTSVVALAHPVFFAADLQSRAFAASLDYSSEQVARAKRKELAVYCSGIVENHEERLFAWIRQDKTAREIRQLLCHAPGGTKHCAVSAPKNKRKPVQSAESNSETAAVDPAADTVSAADSAADATAVPARDPTRHLVAAEPERTVFAFVEEKDGEVVPIVRTPAAGAGMGDTDASDNAGDSANDSEGNGSDSENKSAADGEIAKAETEAGSEAESDAAAAEAETEAAVGATEGKDEL